MNEKISRLADIVRRARKIIALTGAGISVESGIPDFRGSQGLWSKYDPMEYAHIDSFMQDPGKVWNMLAEMDRLVRCAKPNAAHFALAQMERLSKFSSIITQNVDNLHQEAGSSNVIEFHGNSQRIKCLSCGAMYGREEVSFELLPPLCSCGGILKPNVVFFGEQIPFHASIAAASEAQSCDVILVIGTSAVVAPASSIPYSAKHHGATVVEINLEPTPLTGSVADFSIHESAGKVLSEMISMLE